MAYRLKVSCVQRGNAQDPLKCIVAIGGRTPDGSRWWIPHSMAIEGVERGHWAFFIEEDRREIEVVVGQSKDGTKFLRATDDDHHLKRLLSLPRCTSAKMFAQTA